MGSAPYDTLVFWQHRLSGRQDPRVFFKRRCVLNAHKLIVGLAGRGGVRNIADVLVRFRVNDQVLKP